VEGGPPFSTSSPTAKPKPGPHPRKIFFFMWRRIVRSPPIKERSACCQLSSKWSSPAHPGFRVGPAGQLPQAGRDRRDQKASPSQGWIERISIRWRSPRAYVAGGASAVGAHHKPFSGGLRCLVRCGSGWSCPACQRLHPSPPISLYQARAARRLMRPADRRDPQRPGINLPAQGRRSLDCRVVECMTHAPGTRTACWA